MTIAATTGLHLNIHRPVFNEMLHMMLYNIIFCYNAIKIKDAGIEKLLDQKILFICISLITASNIFNTCYPNI